MFYQKIDWLTLVVMNDSPVTILKLLHADSILDDLVVNQFDRDQGYDTRRVFTFNGVSFDFDLEKALANDKENDGYGVFSAIYQKFRVDISGSGLDYLRDIGFDVNSFLDFIRDNFEPDHIRPTRIDYAFDIVNGDYNVLYDFINEVKACEISGLLDPTMRLRFINGRLGGNNYSYRFGNGQATFYFGTPRSESLLRVYDKRLQFLNGNKTFPQFEEVKHNVPITSWIRFELQTRSRFCCNFLRSFRDLETVWKYISSNYRAIDPSSGFVFSSLDKFFGELDEMKIVWHDYYNPLTSFNESIDISWNRCRKLIMYLYVKHGARYIIDLLQYELDKLCISTDPKDVLRRRAFSIFLAEDRVVNGDVYAVSHYVKRLSNLSDFEEYSQVSFFDPDQVGELIYSNSEVSQ